ncbi:MAG: EscU/YscU/HrcU family type III secretion system export apparatus switch protein, partial [Pirellulaceae bacterium]|nr:EscU/YscU/HrcU family type III secretion system export apparatus switch protein [Pirellulaceae bacterium]
LVFGVIDYALQKLKFERDLQMSPEELREEIRAIQNDVSLARRRHLQTGYPSAETDQAGEGVN